MLTTHYNGDREMTTLKKIPLSFLVCAATLVSSPVYANPSCGAYDISIHNNTGLRCDHFLLGSSDANIHYWINNSASISQQEMNVWAGPTVASYISCRISYREGNHGFSMLFSADVETHQAFCFLGAGDTTAKVNVHDACYDNKRLTITSQVTHGSYADDQPGNVQLTLDLATC